jgi:TldD protein
MTDRRDFLKQGAALAAVAALPGEAKALGRLLAGAGAPLPPEAVPDVTTIRALMASALSAAKSGGASYADVRISRQRQNFVFTREQQIQNVVDTDSLGCGVRALVDGTWGFAATRTLTTDGVAAAAREALAIAKANRYARANPINWLPLPGVGTKEWKSAFKIDPFTISVEQKAELLLKANAEAL